MKSEAAVLIACIELVIVAMCVAIVAPGDSRWPQWNYWENMNDVWAMEGKHMYL